MARDIAAEIEQALVPLALAHGLELVAVEVAGHSGRPVVRVFLDREGGIDLDAIAEANPWISDAIDATEAIHGSYVLEVSSPGIERPLRTPRDWDRFAGRSAAVTVAEAIAGRKKLTGVVGGHDGDDAVLEVEGAIVRIPFALIRKAHLVFDFPSFESKETR